MSNSAATFTVNPFPNGVDDRARFRELFGTVAISAGSYPANGIPVTQIDSDPYGSNAPVWLEMQGVSGYVFIYDPTHVTIRIFESAGSAAPLTEVSTTTPSGVVSDTIAFRCTLLRANK